MAQKNRTKKIYYKCAVFGTGTNYNLEDLLTQSLQAVPESERIFNLELHPEGLKLELNDAKENDGKHKGVMLHITTHADDHRLSLVPRKKGVSATGVIDSEQPTDGNLMQQEAIALVRGNHIFITGSLHKDIVFDELIGRLIEKANVVGKYLLFKSQFVASKKAIEMLNKQHVEYIDLDITSDAQQIAEVMSQKAIDGMTNVQAIKALFGVGTAASSPRKSGTVKLRVTGGRIAAAEDPNDAWINQRAKDIVNDFTSDYTIKLKKSGSIKSDSLKIYKESKMACYGHSVSTKSAWNEMDKYYVSLLESGLLLDV